MKLFKNPQTKIFLLTFVKYSSPQFRADICSISFKKFTKNMIDKKLISIVFFY